MSRMRDVDIYEAADPNVKWATDTHLATIETDRDEADMDELLVQFASRKGLCADDLFWCDGSELILGDDD